MNGDGNIIDLVSAKEQKKEDEQKARRYIIYTSSGSKIEDYGYINFNGGMVFIFDEGEQVTTIIPMSQIEYIRSTPLGVDYNG